MGHVTGVSNRSGFSFFWEPQQKHHSRISKPKANRSMEWKLKSGGWKSISPSVARKSTDGATINACNGRKEAPTIHARTLPPGIRAAGYVLEDMGYTPLP